MLSFQCEFGIIGKPDQFRVCDVAHKPVVRGELSPPPASPLAPRAEFFYAASVFGKPRQLESEPALYDAALKILMRRAHSISDMKKALARRCEDEKLVKSVVERLKRENLLDDARYARQFARSRAEYRKQGEYRIARDLRARGVPDRHIETAIEETTELNDPAPLIRQRIERKLRVFRGEIDQKKIASLYRSLLGTGFPADAIRKELHRVTHEEVPDAESEST